MARHTADGVLVSEETRSLIQLVDLRHNATAQAAADEAARADDRAATRGRRVESVLYVLSRLKGGWPGVALAGGVLHVRT